MTLCIAALATVNREDSAAVVAFDSMVSTNIATAENTFKLERLGRRWWALFSGVVPAARELAGYYRTHFDSTDAEGVRLEDKLREDDAVGALKIPVERYYEDHRNHISRLLASLDFTQFLDNRDKFPESVRNAIYHASPLGAEFLFIGCVKDKYTERDRVRLFLESEGDITFCENFGVIGSGEPIAHAALMQRGHSESWELNQTVYAVYEAQRLGTIAPGVGTQMEIRVFRYSDLTKTLFFGSPVEELTELLGGLYDRLGPKPLESESFDFPPGSFLGLEF